MIAALAAIDQVARGSIEAVAGIECASGLASSWHRSIAVGSIAVGVAGIAASRLQLPRHHVQKGFV
jgi:hypothetical protein